MLICVFRYRTLVCDLRVVAEFMYLYLSREGNMATWRRHIIIFACARACRMGAY